MDAVLTGSNRFWTACNADFGQKRLELESDFGILHQCLSLLHCTETYILPLISSNFPTMGTAVLNKGFSFHVLAPVPLPLPQGYTFCNVGPAPPQKQAYFDSN